MRNQCVAIIIVVIIIVVIVVFVAKSSDDSRTGYYNKFSVLSFLDTYERRARRGSTVWASLSNNNFVPLRALKMAVLSYYYFGEKTNDGALTLREERQSQGSSSYNAHRLYSYGCVRKVWVCTYIRVQDPRSTFKVENIEICIYVTFYARFGILILLKLIISLVARNGK